MFYVQVRGVVSVPMHHLLFELLILLFLGKFYDEVVKMTFLMKLTL